MIIISYWYIFFKYILYFICNTYFERYPQNSQAIMGLRDIDGLKEVWFDQKLETTNVNEGEQWYILHPVSLIGYL